MGLALSPGQETANGEPVIIEGEDRKAAILTARQAAETMPDEAEMWTVMYPVSGGDSEGENECPAIVVEAWRKGDSNGIACRLSYQMNDGSAEALIPHPFGSPVNEWV